MYRHLVLWSIITTDSTDRLAQRNLFVVYYIVYKNDRFQSFVKLNRSQMSAIDVFSLIMKLQL